MNFKSIVNVTLAAGLTFSLAGCSSSSSSSDADAFKLGGSGPLSGNAAEYGTAVKNAAEIAVDEINKKDGKVKFELDFEDDQSTGDSASAAFNNLLDWGMQVSLLTTTSGPAQVVAPLYKDQNIFAITPSGSTPAVTFADPDNASDPYGNVFQMCFSDPNIGTAAADYLSEHQLGSKIGIIYRNDDNYSTGVYNKFIEEAKEKKLNIVATETFTDGAADYSVQVKKCADEGADLVFMPIYYQPASQILIEADKEGYKPVFFGCDGMDGILTLDNFDTKYAEGLYMLTPFSADAKDEKTQNFVKAYKEKTGDVPNQFAADAYDAVYAIDQALENSDVTPSSSTDDITSALISQFTSMTFNGITGTDVTWNKNGEVSKTPKAVIIKDGAYVSAD